MYYFWILAFVRCLIDASSERIYRYQLNWTTKMRHAQCFIEIFTSTFSRPEFWTPRSRPIELSSQCKYSFSCASCSCCTVYTSIDVYLQKSVCIIAGRNLLACGVQRINFQDQWTIQSREIQADISFIQFINIHISFSSSFFSKPYAVDTYKEKGIALVNTHTKALAQISIEFWITVLHLPRIAI